MKKVLLLLAFFALTTIAAISQMPEVIVPKGVVIQVYAKKPISTLTHHEGDAIYFLNPSDVYSGEENVFPRNSIFTGYINFLKLPIQGINGALQGKITGVILPDGEQKEINGVLYYRGTPMIGGELAPPASYNQAIHPTKGWVFQSGVLQWVPSGEYEFGRHTTINTRDPIFILLEEDYISK